MVDLTPRDLDVTLSLTTTLQVAEVRDRFRALALELSMGEAITIDVEEVVWEGDEDGGKGA